MGLYSHQKCSNQSDNPVTVCTYLSSPCLGFSASLSLHQLSVTLTSCPSKAGATWHLERLTRQVRQFRDWCCTTHLFNYFSSLFIHHCCNNKCVFFTHLSFCWTLDVSDKQYCNEKKDNGEMQIFYRQNDGANIKVEDRVERCPHSQYHIFLLSHLTLSTVPPPSITDPPCPDMYISAFFNALKHTVERHTQTLHTHRKPFHGGTCTKTEAEISRIAEETGSARFENACFLLKPWSTGGKEQRQRVCYNWWGEGNEIIEKKPFLFSLSCCFLLLDAIWSMRNSLCSAIGENLVLQHSYCHDCWIFYL